MDIKSHRTYIAPGDILCRIIYDLFTPMTGNWPFLSYRNHLSGRQSPKIRSFLKKSCWEPLFSLHRCVHRCETSKYYTIICDRERCGRGHRRSSSSGFPPQSPLNRISGPVYSPQQPGTPAESTKKRRRGGILSPSRSNGLPMPPIISDYCWSYERPLRGMYLSRTAD